MIDATKYVIACIEEDIEYGHMVPFIISPVSMISVQFGGIFSLVDSIVKYISTLDWDNTGISDYSNLLPRRNFEGFFWQARNVAHWDSLFDWNKILYVDFSLIIDNYCLDVLPQEVQDSWVYCPYPGFVPDHDFLRANSGVRSLSDILHGKRGGA